MWRAGKPIIIPENPWQINRAASRHNMPALGPVAA
jgi:hypothetical protein